MALAIVVVIVINGAFSFWQQYRAEETMPQRRFFGNPLITLGVIAEIVLLLSIDYTAPGHAMFGTAPLGSEAWLVILPCATAMLALEEARKAFVRRLERTRLTDFAEPARARMPSRARDTARL